MVLTAKELEIGVSIPSYTRTVSYEMCEALNGTTRTFHSNKEEANRLGFREAVVAGPHLICMISECLTQALGKGWIEGGKTRINFIVPVYAGDTVTVNATVTDRTPEGNNIRIHFQIECQKQDSTKTSVGRASGLVPATT